MDYIISNFRDTLNFENFEHYAEIIGDLAFHIYSEYKKKKRMKPESVDKTDGTEPEPSVEEKEKVKDMFMDASKEFFLTLYLSDVEAEEYERLRRQCWEAPNPIQCKDALDARFRKIVQERMQPKQIPDLTLEMYKASIASLVYIIKKFAHHAGMPDIQCKLSTQENATWIRIPDRIECLHDGSVTAPPPPPPDTTSSTTSSTSTSKSKNKSRSAKAEDFERENLKMDDIPEI